MSKNKGFSNTSVDRYSLALYELANESKLLDQVEENSTTFLSLISNNEDFKNLIKDPTLSRSVLMNIINLISEKFKLQILFRNFLGFLISKRRFFYVEQILRSYNETCSKKRGELKAEIKSAKY